MQVGVFEAKNTLGALLYPVAHGEEIIITRHGKPVARRAEGIILFGAAKEAGCFCDRGNHTVCCR